MKDFLYQTFVLFPLSAGATYGLVMFIGPLCHAGNAANSNFLENGLEIFFIILFFIMFIACACLYLNFRGFKAGSSWWWYGFALTPVRPLLQLVACILAFIFRNNTKIVPEYYFSKKDDNKANVLSLFLNLEKHKKFVPQYRTEENETTNSIE